MTAANQFQQESILLPRQNLTNVAWSYSHLRVGSEELLADVARMCHARIGDMSLGSQRDVGVRHELMSRAGLGAVGAASGGGSCFVRQWW